MLGIPSSPGALNGLVVFSCTQICSLVILPMPLHTFSYLPFACGLFSVGLAGRKLVASAVLFSPFVLAIVSSPCTLYLSFRIFAFLYWMVSLRSSSVPPISLVPQPF